MRLRWLTAIFLVVVVLYIFVSPVIASPKTALRAQQFAAVFFYLLVALGTVLFAIMAQLLRTEHLQELFSGALLPVADPLESSCLLRL